MALEFMGMCIIFIIGVLFGASIMYVFELIMDWKEDKRDERGSL